MPNTEKSAIRFFVNRPPAVASWEYEHRWGTLLVDFSVLRVTRTNGGILKISYGNNSIEVRAELVDILAQMVATAAEWSDEAKEE